MEILFQNVWLIPSLPFIASVLLGVVLFFLPNSVKSVRQFCSFISIFSLTLTMVISIYYFWQQIHGSPIHRFIWSWVINRNVTLHIGYLIDPLTSIMLILVTTIGIVVMIYSSSYMFHDRGYIRFFCFLSLFIASMLGLVLSPNLIQIYIFWELVGMCSYLLIGFWFTRPDAANACQKSFVINRIGDFGLLLGILGFYWITGSFEFQELSKRFLDLLVHNATNNFFANSFAIFLFLGPIAKSAQFPLHIWLPDAMEGPTPISALIHAATMVAAGVFLVARLFPLFQMLPFVMNFISWIGVITAFLGAIIAITQRDLKKALAYSTISQLGYMILALGIGSYKAALFHLITHAYSKALLFLGSGSVIHSIEPIVGYHPNKSQNMCFMGGLRKHMPITAVTFLFGTLSISGIPPFACFWSKDEIIVDSWFHLPSLGFLAFITAGLTAFYMFRIYFLTFEGIFRGHLSDKYKVHSFISIWGNPEFDQNEKKEINSYYLSTNVVNEDISYPQESDNTVLFSLFLLTVPTFFIGFIGKLSLQEKNFPIDFLSNWLHLSINSLNNIHYQNFDEIFQDAIPALCIVLFGILIAFYFYGPNTFRIKFSIFEKLQFIQFRFHYFFLSFFNWSYHQGYFNQFYDLSFVQFLRFFTKFSFLVDRWIIDGIINGMGVLSFFGGECVKYTENGRLSSYLFFLVSSMFLFFLYSYI